MTDLQAFDRELDVAGAELAAKAEAVKTTAAAVRRHLDRTALALAATTSVVAEVAGRASSRAALLSLAGALDSATSPDRVRALRRAFARLAHPDLGPPHSSEASVDMAAFNARCDLALARLAASSAS